MKLIEVDRWAKFMDVEVCKNMYNLNNYSFYNYNYLNYIQNICIYAIQVCIQG